MREGKKVASDHIDRSVFASLRELQEEGEPDIVEEVSCLFIKHAPEKIAAIEKAVMDRNAKALEVAAHSLKSSAAYVGALQLSAISKELEETGRTGLLESADEKAQELKDEYERVRVALELEISSSKKH